MDPVEEIKSKIDLVDFISEYVELKQSGTSWRGICPFHQEKTPSFFVSPEKQIWHCFGCFPKGSLIKKENAFIPIEDIKRGDYVITGDGIKKKVLLTMKRDYHGKLISVQTRKCNEIVSMTADHEVYTVKTQNCRYQGRKTRICQSRCDRRCPTKYFKSYKIEKIPAQDLTKNDYLLYPVNQKIKDIQFLYLSKYLNRGLKNYGPKIRPLKSKIKINNDFLKLLGYYIAEGSNHRAYIRFSLGPRELDFAQEIKVLLKKIFSLESSIHIGKGNRTGIEVTCCNSNLSNIFENLCGKGAENKQIPLEFIFLPFKKQKIIVEAIWKGDGCVSKKEKKSRAGQKSITTISRTLAYQINDILLRLNFEPSLIYAPPKVDKNNVKHRASFTVNWREDLKSSYTDFLVKNNIKYWLLPIRKIDKKDFKGEVYNLTISKIHSYIANHFAVGNCGAGGDLFGFVQEIEGIDFPEALRILAKRAGVEIKEYNRQTISPKTKLFDICYWSAEFYHKILLESSLAKPAEEYLKKRGLNKKIIKEFKIGFAPDKWDTLHQFLTKRGFKSQDIEKAGLVIKSKKGGFYDRFRQRIIFPLTDPHGQITGFTSRILPSAEKDNVPKYINTPETPIYNKSRILYGLDKAKLEAKQKDQMILVEGNMDVLACHQFGFINTVCTSGTALTQEQIKILERYTKNIILAFDVDLAGQAATQRSIDLLLNQGLNVKVLKLSQGKDPDEFIRNNLKGWKESLKNPQPIMEYYFSLAFQDKDLKNIEDKKIISRQLLPLINKLGDPVEKDLWLKRLSSDLNVSEISLREALEKAQKPASFSSYKPAKTTPKISGEQKAGERFLALVINFPEIGKKFIKKIVLDMFSETRSQEILRLLKDSYSENNFDIKKIKKKITQDDLIRYFDFLCFIGEKDFQDFSPKEIEKEFSCLFNLLKKKYLNKKMKKLTQELKEEEQKGNQQEVKNISLKIIKITQELSACE